MKTSEEPYVWKIIFEKKITESEKAVREDDMERFAYVLLGLIGNLDEVEYSYTVGGESFTKAVTAEDATAFFGRNIKDCGKSPRVLGDLLSKTGLDTYVMGYKTGLDTYVMGYEAELLESRNVTLNLVNFTEIEIQAISYSIYSDGNLISSGGASNADNSPVKRGETFNIFFEHGDLGSGKNVTIEFGIEMPDGKNFTVTDGFRVPSEDGAETTLLLCGSVKDGFYFEQ